MTYEQLYEYYSTLRDKRVLTAKLCCEEARFDAEARVEMVDMILDAIDKQIAVKPRKTETIYGVDGCGEVTNKLVLYTCPICDEPIHVGRGCSNNNCRQTIDWSPEKQILKNAKVLQIPKPRIVGEEGDEE